jgi:23S rRNA (uridine2552-2'-O)-methyltransferase
MAQARKIHDRFFKQAKEDGYAARSAYKLKQIQDRRHILKRGDRVIDLGCSPGSWVQVASEIVGEKGQVGGIDLKPVTIPVLPNARAIVADIFKTDAQTLLSLATPEGAATRLVDALLSDMAPSTEGGGGGSADHFRSIELCRRVLDLAPALLRPGGNLVMKVFEGEVYPDLLRDTTKMFADVKGYKPEASRDVSREMFITAKGFKGGPMPATPLPAGIAKAPPKPGAGWGSPGGGTPA